MANENIEPTKTATKAIVNKGMIIILAIIEIRFKVLKKYAIINIKETDVAKLIAKLSHNALFSFVLYNAVWIVFVKRVIPKTQEKLIKKLTSKAESGFIKNVIMPANDIEVKESYSL